MVLLAFAPKRNFQHRIAVLALYRALLRAGSKVELPEDVIRSRRVHPVKHAIRKRFASNVALASPRFLYAAMAAGYRLWDTLCRAEERESWEHQQVIEHFRRRIHKTTAEATEKISRNATKGTPEGTRQLAHLQQQANQAKPAGKVEHQTLLTKASGPGEMPKYTHNFNRSKNNSKKHGRKVPHIAATAEGYPFVRLGPKPQPLPMSQTIERQSRIWKDEILKVAEIEDIEYDEALAEDEWDHLVAGQIAREGLEPDEEQVLDSITGIESTYVWTVQVVRLWHEFKLERRLQDWVARGAALHSLVTEQTALALEKKERNQPQAELISTERLTPGRMTPQPSVTAQVPFKLMELALQSLPAGMSLEDYKSDPFNSPFWIRIVENQQKALAHGVFHKLAKDWLEERKHLRDLRDTLTGGEASPWLPIRARA